ncbi:MAG TPA: hypothetical protein VD813_16180 [Pseudonocardia sp.]|nr:hypothetical protein [Pseudonocardia sp.]
MSENAQYVTLLVISVALTVAVGRVLVVAGQPFLQDVFHDERVSRSVSRLLSVLFHLVTLGVLAIISVAEVRADGALQSVVVKLGVVLLVLGIAYGISMLVLIRIRERRRATEISERARQRVAERRLARQPGLEQGVVPPQP